MSKPVIWTVDDDPDVLRAVERDLRRHYGDRYRVMSLDSGIAALEATKQLKLRNEPVALFLVDQRMPGMSGVEFLEKSIELYPDAKRALLTAYADISFRKLDVPGLERLLGSGVYYYAAMSQAFSYRDGNIYIVGGANSAGQAAMYFSKFARQVTILVRGKALSDSMSQYLEDEIAATKNIEVRLNSVVTVVEGKERCETITIQNNETHATGY